jgi:hypothetical protein
MNVCDTLQLLSLGLMQLLGRKFFSEFSQRLPFQSLITKTTRLNLYRMRFQSSNSSNSRNSSNNSNNSNSSLGALLKLLYDCENLW